MTRPTRSPPVASTSLSRWAPAATALLAIVLSTVPAHAGLQQPNGQAIPVALSCSGGKTTGLGAVFACVCTQPGICNIGAACPGGSTSCDPGTNGTCETTIWHDVNDNSCIPSNLSGLDPVAAAQIIPETFHPTCAQTFTVVSRGTALFQNAFGWYNATGTKPAASDLNVILDCNAAPGATAVLDLATEPTYTGGEIGFFLITPESHTASGTCDSGNCCATTARVGAGAGYAYYSESKYNPDSTGPNPWIHLLEYTSRITPAKFYFAWEDTEGSPSVDFTDLVTSVSGIACSGAGVTCDTGKQGVCATGITKCTAGMVGCSQVFMPTPEVCNGLDDDCNGMIDDGAICADPTEVCYHGSCVPHCDSGEFPCLPGSTCDTKTGLCITNGCLGVTCTSGQVCHAGVCTAPCMGVVCPHGQTCVDDACVDLCKAGGSVPDGGADGGGGTTCPPGEICRAGQCFPSCTQCSGISCVAPESKCDPASGACVDPSCATPCAAGTFCSQGQCVNDCTGAVCPNGQTCSNGTCQASASSSSSSSSSGVGFGGSSPSGSSSASSASSSSGAGGAGGGVVFSPATDCGCRTIGGGEGGMGALCGLAAAAALAPRRRRRRVTQA